MERTLAEWIVCPPTHLTENEALERGARIVKDLVGEVTDPIFKNEFLVMLMLYWHNHKCDLEFRARFYDFRTIKETTNDC